MTQNATGLIIDANSVSQIG